MNIIYTVIIHKKAHNAFKSLLPSHQNKVREIIKSLSINPYTYPYVKIKGEDHLYRIRVGDYRILFEVHNLMKQVVIFKIETRTKVYRNV